jgi:hypothetical protein
VELELSQYNCFKGEITHNGAKSPWQHDILQGDNYTLWCKIISIGCIVSLLFNM